MAKRAGKYKLTKRDNEISLRDGGQIDGQLKILTPKTLFKWNYITCGTPLLSHAQSSDTATADGHRAPMLWPSENGQLYHTEICRVGATTAALETPVFEGTVPATDTGTTAAGLNMQMDQDTAADLGWEMTLGSPLGSNAHSFTVGTHTGHVDMTLFAADYTSYDAVSVGFRKVENFNTGHAPVVAAGTGDPLYTDFATFGLQESDKIQYAADVNNGGSGVYADTTQTPTDSQNQRFRIALNADGSVTQTLVQNAEAGAGTLAAPTTSSIAIDAFKFDTGDVLIPYIFIHGANHTDTALLVKDIEIVRTPGIAYDRVDI
jgi:hypothetical protein